MVSQNQMPSILYLIDNLFGEFFFMPLKADLIAWLVPENFGAEPNIDSSVRAGFECTPIAGKLLDIEANGKASSCFRMHQPLQVVSFGA